MDIELIRLTDLKPHPHNPNRGDDEVVARSIRRFGFRAPIIVDADNGIVAGHTRARAAALCGLTEVPCVRAADLSPAEIRAYMVADNQTARRATTDLDDLAAAVDGLDGDLIGAMGFVEGELERMLTPPVVAQPEFDESAADDVEWLECPECHHRWPK